MKPPFLTYVYSYYNNPMMLNRQVDEWMTYPRSVLDRLQIIVTDDCSEYHPIRAEWKSTLSKSGLNIRLFRITRKVNWNWLACRNIGAHYADGQWLLLTDMDHLVQRCHAERLMKWIRTNQVRTDWVYLFTRINAKDNAPFKNHEDSFLMSKDLFWNVGGYDEELSGNYGTSGSFRRRAFRVASDHIRLSLPLTRYSTEDIPDASTTNLPRKEGRGPANVKSLIQKKEQEGRANKFLTLTFPYEELK